VDDGRCKIVRLSQPTYAASDSLRGIAKGKAAGIYKGRPASIEASRVRELKAQGIAAG
jgi:hypothetical protein